MANQGAQYTGITLSVPIRHAIEAVQHRRGTPSVPISYFIITDEAPHQYRDVVQYNKAHYQSRLIRVHNTQESHYQYQ